MLMMICRWRAGLALVPAGADGLAINGALADGSVTAPRFGVSEAGETGLGASNDESWLSAEF